LSTGKKENPKISSEEATSFKSSTKCSITLAFEPKIELTDGNLRGEACCQNTAADETLTSSFEPPV